MYEYVHTVMYNTDNNEYLKFIISRGRHDSEGKGENVAYNEDEVVWFEGGWMKRGNILGAAKK